MQTTMVSSSLSLSPGTASSGFLFFLWMPRYSADYTPAHCNWSTPCLHAHIQGPRNPSLQLCAPALVKPAAHPSEWGQGGRNGRGHIQQLPQSSWLEPGAQVLQGQVSVISCFPVPQSVILLLLITVMLHTLLHSKFS
jgi:hypothetical protein